MALTSAPTLIVEVGFASDPTTSIAGTTWTDVTAYCRTLKTRAGRQHELQRAEPSTADLVFDNTDGRFDPTNTSSPYYPNVTTDKRLRIRATWNAITYPIFCGTVESWGTQWPEVTEAFMAVTAADGLKNLNLVTMLSPYVEQCLADSPTGYWRLHEASSGVMAADISGRSWPGVAWYGTPTFGQTGPIVDGEQVGGVKFNDATRDYLDLGLNASLPSTPPASIKFWFKASGNPAGTTKTLFLNADISVILLNAGAIQFTYRQGQSVITGTSGYGDNAWHRIDCVADPVAQTLTVYIDNVVRAGPSAMAIIGGPVDRVYFGGQPGAAASGVDVTCADLALYPGIVLSAARIAAQYNAKDAYPGQLSGSRVSAVLDMLGWPSADRSIEAGASTLQSEPVLGNALGHLIDVAKSESGLFYQAPDGKMTFLQRTHLITAAVSTTSQATFGDAPGQLPYLLGGIAPVFDDMDLYNAVQETRRGGAMQQALDPTSRTAHGRRTLPETGLKIQSDSEALDRANYLLGRYKNPVTRVRAFTVSALSDPANIFPQILGRSLWDRITFRRQPPGGGAAFSQQSLIEGIEHSYQSKGDWRTTFKLSAADTASYMVLDATVQGQLDSNALAY